MKKKIAAVLLSVLMASSVLTGCLGGQESQTEETETGTGRGDTGSGRTAVSGNRSRTRGCRCYGFERAYSHGYGKIYG